MALQNRQPITPIFFFSDGRRATNELAQLLREIADYVEHNGIDGEANFQSLHLEQNAGFHDEEAGHEAMFVAWLYAYDRPDKK
jgi:hypothetical protein